MHRSTLEWIRVASVIPRNSIAVIRQRWLEVMGESSAARRILHKEIETGVHAIVAPGCAMKGLRYGELHAAIRQAQASLPEMARPVRLSFAQLTTAGPVIDGDSPTWMGRHAAEVASGRIQALVFLDMAYLEAALLDCFYGSEVDMHFNVPIATFRRGELTDYANLLEAAARMVVEGWPLIHSATRVAEQVLTRLETYAEAFVQLSSLYSDARWRMQDNTFLMEIPARGISLALRYWELRNDASGTLKTWKRWIESLLEGDSLRESTPQSFAA
jgi:hypothetical protein